MVAEIVRAAEAEIVAAAEDVRGGGGGRGRVVVADVAAVVAAVAAWRTWRRWWRPALSFDCGY